MQVVNPNNMKFSGKRHLRGVDDSRFLQAFATMRAIIGVFDLPRSGRARKDSRELHPRHT